MPYGTAMQAAFLENHAMYRPIMMAILASLLTLATLTAATINVPAEYPTIQAGLDAAVNGDTVLVAAGTYVENIDFKGKGLTVASSAGASATVIDGSKAGSVVKFTSGEGADSILQGFTITNGTGTYFEYYPGYGNYYGGGVFCQGSAPALAGNTIIKNAAYVGGGICCYEASLDISNSLIQGNKAISGAGICCTEYSSMTLVNSTVNWNVAKAIQGASAGGGVDCSQSELILRESTISDNTADWGGGLQCNNCSLVKLEKSRILRNTGEWGGGLCLLGNSHQSINSCLISQNTASQDGGGIACWSDFLSLSNDVISENIADWWGAGIEFFYTSADLVNCTFSGNAVTDYYGGAIYASASSLTMTNMIFCYDTAPLGKEVYLEESSSLTISYSDVKGGIPSITVEPGSKLNWGDRIIDADPMFVNAGKGDFHLLYPSPCRDAGDKTAVTEMLDFKGDPRIVFNTVDLGADEFYRHFYVTGDKTPGGSIQAKLVGWPGTKPLALIMGSNVLESPVKTNWGLFYWRFRLLCG